MIAISVEANCKVCRKPISGRRSTLQTKCVPCVIAEANARDRAAAKAQRQAAIDARKQYAADKRETKAKLLSLEPLQYWLKRAEKAVNRYVRLRDHEKGCISCPLPSTWDGRWNASHLRSVGAASAVRYHLWNIHKACYPCNQAKSGNIGEYLPRVRALIGDDRVDWLYTQNQRASYTREYLERLERVFTKKANRLEKQYDL